MHHGCKPKPNTFHLPTWHDNDVSMALDLPCQDAHRFAELSISGRLQVSGVLLLGIQGATAKGDLVVAKTRCAPSAASGKQSYAFCFPTLPTGTDTLHTAAS